MRIADFELARPSVAGASLRRRAEARSPPPKALVDARADYAKAKGGIALQLDPTDVHEADLALQKAESAWNDSQDPNDEHAIDLAIIAQRKAQIARPRPRRRRRSRTLQQAKSDLEATMAVAAPGDARPARQDAAGPAPDADPAPA